MFIAKKRFSMRYFSNSKISILIGALNLFHNQKCSHKIILEHSGILNFLEFSFSLTRTNTDLFLHHAVAQYFI